MSKLNKYLTSGTACLGYGALITLAFAPFGYVILSILSPALLFNSWLHKSPVTAFRNGYLFGIGMFGTGVGWLHISINLFGGVNLIGAILITLLLIMFLALFPAVIGYIGRKYFANSTLVYLLLGLPALWVLAEWFRAWIFTGFPWLNLGYSHIDSPLNGLAPVLGVYGISLATIITSTMLVALFHIRLKQRTIIALVAIFLWLTCWLLKDIVWTDEIKSDYKVALIQGAVPQKIKWNPEMRQPSLNLYMDLSSPHWHTDLIIWPETAIPAYYHREMEFIDSLQQMAQSTDTNMLTGIVVMNQETGRYYNSMLMLNNEVSTYFKKHLVPFGEYMPFDAILRPLLNFLEIPMSNFSSGDRSEKPLLKATDVIIGVSICYEDTFGEEVLDALPEANILVNISNDAWFGDSIAPHQHLQMARMRALETGRYLLRSTNTGITAIIDEKGKIVKRSEQFEANSISSEVSLFEGITPYALYGNLPVIITLALLLAGLVYKEKSKKI